jgi:AraC family transcriptional regulator, alkane utilization regulator
MDLLADALSIVQFTGTVYCQTEFTAPWGVDWEQRAGHAGFFMVTRGGCYMDSDAFREPLALRPGDFVITPKAKGYILRDSPSGKAKRFDDVAGAPGTVSSHRVIQYGGGGVVTNLIMGCFKFDETSKNPLIQSLPDFIVVKAEEMQAVPWLEPTLRFLASECSEEKLGSSLTVSKLTELVFVQAIRFYLSNSDHRTTPPNWLKGAADPCIGRALSRMHESPEAPWTVASLAEASGMSRSAFASRFKELTNTSPLDYLTIWRMQKAEKLISDGGISLAEVSAIVGYQSEAAFSKAFKREIGVPPGMFKPARAAR